MQLNLHHHQLNSSTNTIFLIFMLNIKPHDTTLLLEDTAIYLLAYFGRQPHTHLDAHVLNAHYKNIAAKFAHILTKMSTIHNKYVHLHQQLLYFELPTIT